MCTRYKMEISAEKAKLMINRDNGIRGGEGGGVRLKDKSLERSLTSSTFGAIDLFHIIISLSLTARYLASFRGTSQRWGKL